MLFLAGKCSGYEENGRKLLARKWQPCPVPSFILTAGRFRYETPRSKVKMTDAKLSGKHLLALASK